MTHATHGPRSASCPDCAVGQFTRNYYFDGKFMVARDFWDEQRFNIDKLRHHHQRLHGRGIVCGLDVVPHDVPECRNRYVCVQPGTAIDCCGHEIVVREETLVDLWQLEALAGLRDQPDGMDHVVQLCIRFKECPTEDVPVLYDDCGCDDTACLPNRILESFEIDAILDPPPSTDTPRIPRLDWIGTIGVPRAAAVAVPSGTPDPATLFVLTGDNPGLLVPATLANGTPGVPAQLDGTGLSIAASDDGTRVYVAVAPADATKPRRLEVFDAANLAAGPVNTIDVQGSVGEAIDLATGPGGRLVMLLRRAGQLLVWSPDVNTPPAPATPAAIPIGGADLVGLAVVGTRAYSVEPVSRTVRSVDVGGGPAGVTLTLPAGHPMGIVAARGTGPDALVVIDDAAGSPALHLVAPATGTLKGTAALAAPPVAVVVGAGGGWAYVVEHDNATSTIEPVNLFALASGVATQPRPPFTIGEPAGWPVIAGDGSRVLVPFTGSGPAAAGGVAVIAVAEEACRDLEWDASCPTCEGPDCVVLTTIERYRPDDRVEAQTTPPADAATDRNAGRARLDPHGRRRLPSVQALAEMVECLLENGGGTGVQGPPGQDGTDGTDGTNGTNGTNGVDGVDGKGLERDLTRIFALSWRHAVAGGFVPITLQDKSVAAGLVIGTTREVDVTTVDSRHVFQVLVDTTSEGDAKETGWRCRCSLDGRIMPVETQLDATGELVIGATEVPGPMTKGIAFVVDDQFVERVLRLEDPELWVIVRGDFVIDSGGRALDADFLRAQLPTGDGPIGTNLGIQGGLFESWFQARWMRDVPLDPNVAPRATLLQVRGIGDATADRIIAARADRPFASATDFRKRSGLAPAVWTAIRDRVRIEE